MRAFRLMVTALILMVGPVTTASAQGLRLQRQMFLPPMPPRPVSRPAPSPQIPEPAWANLFALEGGTTLEVGLKSGLRRGRFVTVSDDALTIEDNGREVRLSRDDIRIVQRRVSPAKKTAAAKAIVGAAAGFLLGALIDDQTHRTDVLKVKMVITGAVIGGTVGVAEGVLSATDRVLYRAN